LLGFINKSAKERVVTRALSCLAAILVASGLAFAAPNQPPPFTASDFALYESGSEDMRVHALIVFARAGQQEQTAELLKRYPLRGPHAANRTLFIQGLILEGRRDYFGAARKFRAALADNPKLTLVRSELAKVLIAIDENESAAHHLRLLEADAPNAADAAGIRSFIDKIGTKKPLSFSGYFSVAPTTNVNNGSNHDKLISENIATNFPGLNPTGTINNQKQSGLGLSGGLNAGYSKRLNDRLQFIVGAGVNANIYTDSQFDSASTSESAELRYLFTDGYFGLGGISSQSFAPPNNAGVFLTYNDYGPRASFSYQLTQRDLLNSSLTYVWRDYAGSVSADGTALHSDLAITHALDSTLNVTGFGGYDRAVTQDPSSSYHTYFGGVNIYKEFTMGMTIDANAQIRVSPFDGVDSITGFTRYDTRYVGGLTLTKRDFNIWGFAPSINYSYTLNKSNNALFDYDSHSFNFNFTKDF
jgi:outer membrane protein